jgi:hypothetical protein
VSIEIRLEFQPPIRGIVYQAEGKALASRLRSIHSLSKKRGIPPITDFLVNRGVSEEDAESDEWKAARRDWHPPADGLQAVRALREAIQSDPQIARRWTKDDPDAVETLLDDLDELARCLEAAARKGVQFRLDVV